MFNRKLSLQLVLYKNGLSNELRNIITENYFPFLPNETEISHSLRIEDLKELLIHHSRKDCCQDSNDVQRHFHFIELSCRYRVALYVLCKKKKMTNKKIKKTVTCDLFFLGNMFYDNRCSLEESVNHCKDKLVSCTTPLDFDSLEKTRRNFKVSNYSSLEELRRNILYWYRNAILSGLGNY